MIKKRRKKLYLAARAAGVYLRNTALKIGTEHVWNTALKIGTEHVGLSSSFFLGSWKVEGKKRWTKKKFGL